MVLECCVIQAHSLDIAFCLEVLTLDKVWNIIIVVIFLVLAVCTLLQALVAFCKLPQRCERIWAKLIEDAGNKFGELFILAIAVDGERVGRDRGVHYHEDQLKYRDCWNVWLQTFWC